MTDKLIYYRGKELISPKDLKRMRKLWGSTPYNWVEELPIDHNTGTGIHNVTEIMFTIWNDRNLNERSDALIERIKKGLTRSKGTYHNYVEENLLIKLITDATTEFNKIAEVKLEWYRYPLEFLRLYNIPYDGVIKELNECEAKVGVITKPVSKIKYKSYLPVSQDQCSVFKQYAIKGSISLFSEKHNHLYKIFPYLCKLHDCRGYVQLYVYDYKNRDWAMQNVLNYLVENKLIHLE
jgi:hypothetical protein